MNDTCLYVHTRVSDGIPFYVGIGLAHRPHNVNNRNAYWHSTVKKHGYRVDIVATNLTWAEACAAEIELIAYLRADPEWGPKLTNLTDGGEGTKGWSKDPKNAEWLAKNVASMRQLWDDPEFRANQAAGMRQLWDDPEFRANQAASMRKRSPEWKTNHAAAMRNKSPEWLANQAAATREACSTAEWKTNHAAANRKMTQSPEWKAKMGRANKASVKVAIQMANLNGFLYTCLL